MPPRTRARKPLANVPQNEPMPRPTRSTMKQQRPKRTPAEPAPAEPAPTELAPPPAEPVEETLAVHVDIAHITSQLEGTKISSDSSPAGLPETTVNPFGGTVPPSASFALPKRPLTAYQQFCKNQRDQICQQHPGAKFAEINSLLGAAWKALSPEQRSEFEQSVAEDRHRYDQEMTQYKEQQQQLEKERMAIEFYEKELRVQKALEFYEKHLAEQKDAVKNVPAPPKQARSAYNFFVASRFKETGGNSVFGLSAQIAKEWKALQGSRNKKGKALVASFEKMAAEDEQRYRAETEEHAAALAEQAEQKAQEHEQFKKAAVEAYETNLKEKEDAQAFRKLQAELKMAQKQEKKKLREEKKAAKEAKSAEPKRPKNAYAIFFSKNAAEVSEYIKETNVEHTMAKEVAARWKALSDAEKEPYLKEAENDRVRYRNEMEAFNATQQ